MTDISDEAIQAAVSAVAIAVFETRDDPYDTNEWEDLDSTERERWECYARAALEAAAPIIRQQVAEEIRVEMRRHDSAQTGFSAVGDAYAHAARIAEGDDR